MQIIYQTFRNSDLTEGRGPMVPDKAFTRKDVANSYIDDKPGAMGRKCKWSEASYGDWTVREVKVYDDLEDAKAGDANEARERALAKLNAADRAALGL